jgi:hypothetical protein
MSVVQVPTEGADHGPNGLQSSDQSSDQNTTQNLAQSTTQSADVAGRQERRRLTRKRRRRGRVTAVVVIVLIAAGGGGYYYYTQHRPHAAATTSTTNTATGLAQVTRGNLSARTTQNGTLGFAGDYKIVNKADGAYTKLPAVGDIIKQGSVLYWVADKPVVFLYGAYVPVYRALKTGDDGADVKQLNAALVALNYATKSQLDPTSDHFGKATATALKKLQKAVGLDQTGDLPLGQAVFLTAKEIRVTEVTGVVGGAASPNQSFMSASSTSRQVSVSLRASQQTTVSKGDDVTISLPDGKTTPGKVTAVGKVATKDSDGNVTVEVLITPDRPEDTGTLDKAPVQVSIVSDTAKDVLSVPVGALLALAGGGYAVEVVDVGGAHHLVRVETGLFDNSAGRVQVSGAGLTEGQNVVVPAS